MHKLLNLALVAALPAATYAQIAIDGIAFTDRAVTGEVVLGNVRGGLAVLDFDDDGYTDLVIRDYVSLPTRLFHNQADPLRPGARTFVDVTAGSGLDDADGTSRDGFGVVAADYDNDGDVDVFITGYHTGTVSAGLLYRNEGGGVFTNVSVSAGIRTTGLIAQSASWTDFDLDGHVDLVTCNRASPQTVSLFRNNGDGTFSDANALLPPVREVSHVYAHTWMDYDHDGYADGFILMNGGTPVLLKNVDDGQGGRRFDDAAVPAGFTRLGRAPMGIAAGDYDGDGHLDLAITDAQVGTYYRNLGDSVVEVFPFETFFGWGVMWIDVDNDADLDNYYVGSWSNPNLDRLSRNIGDGQWENISAALNTTSLASQHSVQIDFNNDGRQDIITINPGTPGQFISVYENVSTTGNHWFKVRLRGDGAEVNRDAIGAVIRLVAAGRVQVREIISGSSTTATEDPRQNFGVGAAETVDRIEVVWPRQGTIASRTSIYQGPFAADQIVTLTPGPPRCPADLDGDGDVDNDDWDLFEACLTGPAVPQASPACITSRLDGDNDTDQSDFGIFQRCLSGPDEPADPACAE